MMHRVSIIVLTHNRKGELLRTLDKLHDLEAPYAIYVIDNASTDGSADAAIERHPDVRVIRLRRNIGAAARNAGVAAAQTPYVAFCDDDTWWAPGALARASKVMDCFPRLAALTACVLVGSEARIDPACARMARSPLPNELGVPGTAVLGCLAGACIMRRSAFMEAGGYQPRFFLGREEALLALDLMAADWHMAYTPSVVVHHHPSALRDATVRRRLLLRNGLWCAWLRRPWKSAMYETARLIRTAMHDPARLRGAADALGAMPWILRNRRVIPPRVERALQLVQHD
jgi:GT2 family glycosyltransferase